MTDEQRRRHDVRPGLTGLAQVNGRNNITWEQKMEYDLLYIDGGISFFGDVKIILKTVGKVFRRDDTVREGTASDIDFGDWLMQQGKVDQQTYEQVDLFTTAAAPKKEKQEKLEDAMDIIRQKYGKRAIVFGAVKTEKEEDPLP